MPSWPHIVLVQLTQNAPLPRMPSSPTSWTLRSSSPPSLRHRTILLSTPAALRRMLRGRPAVPNTGILKHTANNTRTHWTDSSCLVSSITYNGSMESPVPLYPTDCPPPYEAVMGQRAASQVSTCVHLVDTVRVLSGTSRKCRFFSFWSLKATMFDPHGAELSGERGTSTAFSGEGEKASHHLKREGTSPHNWGFPFGCQLSLMKTFTDVVWRSGHFLN